MREYDYSDMHWGWAVEILANYDDGRIRVAIFGCCPEKDDIIILSGMRFKVLESKPFRGGCGDSFATIISEPLKPCRSPYCECSEGCCSHPGCYDARNDGFSFERSMT